MTWAPFSEEGLIFRAWDGDDLAVVYNRSSGDTHLLEKLALEMLCLIHVSPQTADSLATKVEEILVADKEGNILEFVEATLLKLQDAELVKRILF